MAIPNKIDRVTGVQIELIDQSAHRYATVGDWTIQDDGVLIIRVTRFEDIRMSWAVAIHELLEALLCTQNGITAEQVDEFDMGQGADYDEPGMHPSAPYHKEHIFATALERKFVNALGLSWEIYDKTVQDKGVYHGNETPNA